MGIISIHRDVRRPLPPCDRLGYDHQNRVVDHRFARQQAGRLPIRIVPQQADHIKCSRNCGDDSSGNLATQSAIRVLEKISLSKIRHGLMVAGN